MNDKWRKSKIPEILFNKHEMPAIFLKNGKLPFLAKPDFYFQHINNYK